MIKKLFLFTFMGVFMLITAVAAQSIQTISYSQLQKEIEQGGAQHVVVNFWASWCGSCVKELPWLDTISSQYDKGEVKVIFVSMDDEVFAKKTLPKILKKLHLQSPTYRLLYKDSQALEAIIRQVDKDWEGDLPATIITNTQKKETKFYSGELSPEKLKQILKTI